tara:strand:- start:1076 stop:1852 length:777 start_codon:yes stop_codon:yes gene_type:complete
MAKKKRRRRRPVAKFSLPVVSEAEQLDPIAAKIQAQARRVLGNVGCDHGCSDCCYQQVFVTAPELFRIYDLVRSLPEEAQTRIAARAKEAEDALRHKRGKARVDTRVACPLLADDGRCSAYEARPMPCKALWVSEDTREQCGADFSPDDVVVTIYGPGMEIAMRAQYAIPSHPAHLPPFDLHKAIGPMLRRPNPRDVWRAKGSKMLKNAFGHATARHPWRRVLSRDDPDLGIGTLGAGVPIEGCASTRERLTALRGAG